MRILEHKSAHGFSNWRFDNDACLRNCRLLESERKEAAAGGSRRGGRADPQNRLWKHQWCVLPLTRCVFSGTGRIDFKWSVRERTQLWIRSGSRGSHLKLPLSLAEGFTAALFTQPADLIVDMRQADTQINVHTTADKMTNTQQMVDTRRGQRLH